MSKTEWTQFEQALLDANLEEFADIPAEDAIDLTLSEEFELEGMDLLEKARRGRVPRFGKALRRALLIAAIIAALATAAMAIPTVREAIIDFFSQNEGTHYEFEFDPEQAATAPEYIYTVYRPTYVPKGYHVGEEIVNFAGVTYIWRNADGSAYINYYQCPLPISNIGGPDAEGVITRYINLDGYKVFCIYEDDWKYYSWTNNEYFFELSCYGEMPEEEIFEMFKSITIDPSIVIDYHN